MKPVKSLLIFLLKKVAIEIYYCMVKCSCTLNLLLALRIQLRIVVCVCSALQENIEHLLQIMEYLYIHTHDIYHNYILILITFVLFLYTFQQVATKF